MGYRQIKAATESHLFSLRWLLGVGYLVALALQALGNWQLPSGAAGSATSDIVLVLYIFWLGSAGGWLLLGTLVKFAPKRSVFLFWWLFALIAGGVALNFQMVMEFGYAT